LTQGLQPEPQQTRGSGGSRLKLSEFFLGMKGFFLFLGFGILDVTGVGGGKGWYD